MDEVLDKAAHGSGDPKAETLARIAASIQSSMQPVRPLPPAWMMAGGLVLICAAVAFAGAARAGFLGFSKMDLPERFLIFPVLALLTWAAAIGFMKEMTPASHRRVSAGTLLGLSIAVLLALFALLFRDYQTDHFVSLGVVCLATGFLHAIPVGLLSWLVVRRGFALNPVAAGMAAGALAGLAGVGVLELHCPDLEAAHILVWHTAVVPVSGAAGALVGWIVRRRESRFESESVPE
jgi:hypothetical protein